VSGLLIAVAPALPLHSAGKYVAGAYIVLFVIVLIYVAIMAIRMSRIERDLSATLARLQESEASTREAQAQEAEVL
jgi:hypothetical protein